jgi:ubiquinone/menaquinone biosynthesis C-methylase UbiE
VSNENNRESWNRLSDYYQNTTIISLNDIHYGPFSPGEKNLQIIGSVKGLDVLELGCGGGQNSIVCAKWGAKSVKGIDQSENQIEYAIKLAQSQNVEAEFIQGNMEDLSVFKDNSFDLIISSHALAYVEDINKVFNESARLIREKGRIVICLGHPIMRVTWQALEEKSIEKIHNYFDEKRDLWDWPDHNGESIATFGQTYPRFEQIINGLITVGFIIERIVEPRSYTPDEVKQLGDKIPYQNYPIDTKFIELNRIIPFSLIVSAIKN